MKNNNIQEDEELPSDLEGPHGKHPGKAPNDNEILEEVDYILDLAGINMDISDKK